MKPSKSHEVELKNGECIDCFMDGRLKLIQSSDGYRFSIDAILLSQFVTIRPRDVVIDLGTGCAVILLALLLTRDLSHAFGLEIQEELASQSARNAILNGLQDKMDIVIGDIKHPPLSKGSADVVVCNPPYQEVKRGRINPDTRKAIARHELLASLDNILLGARDLLRKKGRLALIYPAFRLTDVLVRMRRFGLEPKKIQVNYPGLKSDAELVLIEALLGGRPGVEIAPPIFGQGDFSI